MFLSIVIPIHRNALMLISPPILLSVIQCHQSEHIEILYIYTLILADFYIFGGKIMLGYLTYYLGQIYITPTLTRISGVEKR